MNKKTLAFSIAGILCIGGAFCYGFMKTANNSMTRAYYVDRQIDFASLIAGKLSTDLYTGKITVSKNDVSYVFGVKNVYTDASKKSIYFKDGCILNYTAINGMTSFVGTSSSLTVNSAVTTTFKDMYGETNINFTDGSVMAGLTSPDDIDNGYYTHFLIENETDIPIVIDKLQVSYSCENGNAFNVDTNNFDVSSDIDIGQGTTNNPYEIKDRVSYIEYGQKISSGVLPSDTCFILKNDITVYEQFSNSTSTYKGTFDGNGHTIHYYPDYESINSVNVGMFNILDGAVIKDLNIEGIFETKGDKTMYVGTLAGTATNSIFTNINVDVDIMGNVNVGGLVAEDNNGYYENCSYMGVIDGSYILYAGGITAQGQNTTIDGSTFGGIIYSKQLAGGIIGELNGGYVTGCTETSNGQVLGPVDIGGIVGYGHGDVEIFDCSADGYVVINDGLTEKSNTGGIVGKFTSSSTISYCNVTATIRGWENVGGIAGYSESTITNCSFTGNITGDICLGGIVGRTTKDVSYCIAGSSSNPIYLSGKDSVLYAGGIVGNTSASISKCNAYVKVDVNLIDNAIGSTGGIVGAIESENNVSIDNVYVDACWNKSTENIGKEENQYVGFYCGHQVSENVEYTNLLVNPYYGIKTTPTIIG